MTRIPTPKEWRVESYSHQARERWPERGQHVLAQYDENSVVVYQAFRPEIADYAVEHQRFTGCPSYNPTRMTWIKTNFLWMMFRSKWASSPDQERILAIWLRRDRFDAYLSHARTHGKVPGVQGTIRLQWDPDHFPDGTCHPDRRAVQLGIKEVSSFTDGSDILQIVDVTSFVHAQAKLAVSQADAGLMVASERVYMPESRAAIQAIDLTLPTG
jgi:hypothetical protein